MIGVDTAMGDYFEFERNLQSLLHMRNVAIQGAVLIGILDEWNFYGRIGENNRLKKMIRNASTIASADVGHVFLLFTVPIGGADAVKVDDREISMGTRSHSITI